MQHCGYNGCIIAMPAAGVRGLKNKLSEYLRLVAEGETVLALAAGDLRVTIQRSSSFLHGGWHVAGP
jgi:hypothetical protein